KSQGHCWLALEHVEGVSVATLLQHHGTAGIRDWREAVRVALHVARALAFVHQHQLRHGNITPANILVRGRDRSAHLNDLVLVRALGGSQLWQSVLQAKLTAELSYLPPEQTHGAAHTDARSDIYSLGATVYALLTGRPPFQAPNAQEMVKKIRKIPPTAPRQLRPNVPEPFENVLLKMLAKVPDAGYPTAVEWIADLESIAKPAGVTA